MGRPYGKCRLKILYHHRTASKDGQDVHIEEMIGALRALGHEVVVVAPPMAPTAQLGHDGGLVSRIRKLLPRALYELLEFGYTAVAYRRLARAAREHRPDVLYERYNLYLLAGVVLARRTGIPYLLEVNAPLVHERGRFGGLALNRLARWTEHTAWRTADVVLPVTDRLADHVRAAGVPEERIRVIPNGINRARFPADLSGDPARLELGLEGKVVLGFTGFLRSWHGLPRVIDVIAGMPERNDLHFLVIGDGPAKAELEEHARRRGVADRLTTLGLVPRDRVGHYVAAFDVALQPDVVEYASPLKLFEYMSLGRAIVAPDQPNIREVLADGRNALLFDPASPDGFQAAVARLCRDDALRARIGAAAARTIEERDFTWLGNARRVVALAEGLRAKGAEAAAARAVPADRAG